MLVVRKIVRLYLCLLLSVLSVCVVYAQNIDENPMLRYYIDNTFSMLDKSNISTGLLADYAIDLIEWSNYNGGFPTSDNCVSIVDYENILRSIRSACVRTAKPFGNVDDIMNSFVESETDSDGVSEISLALYKYNRIKSNALTDGLIGYESNKVFDVYNNNGEWVNPYEEDEVIAFALSNSVFTTGSMNHIELSTEFLFSNMLDNVANISLNTGEGSGWTQLRLGGTYNICYNTVGEKDVKLKIDTKDRRVLFAHTKVNVVVPPPIRVSSENGYDERDTIDTILDDGRIVSAIYTIISSGAKGSVVRPFIFVEGFDPSSIVNTLGNYAFLGTSYLNTLRNFNTNAYDLIYIDWLNSLVDIRDNAKLLEQIIEKINERKRNSGSTEKNILMGHSMGGLVARYALRSMEEQGKPHDVATYVSYDSPHLGANVPLGAQYFIPQVLSLLRSTGIYSWEEMLNFGLLSEAEALLYDVVHAQSVKQMAINYLSPSGILDNSVHNDWLEELHEIGLPQGDAGVGIKNLAIANGGEVLKNLVDDEHLFLMEGYARTKYLSEILLPLLSYLGGYNLATTTALLGMPILTDLLTLWGSSRIDWHAEINPLSMYSNNNILSKLNVSYTKKYLWVAPISYDLFDATAYAPTVTNYADDYYSSFYSMNNWSSYMETSNNNWGEFKNSIQFADRFAFVPTASALYYKSGVNLTHSDYVTDFANVANLGQIDTPFDAYFLSDTAYSHMHISNDMMEWVVDNANMKINGSGVAHSGSVYVCDELYEGPAVRWSTSNPQIATIDETTGTLTAVGSGVVDIIAQASEQGKVLYKTSKKVLVGFPDVIIDMKYEVDEGYVFTAQLTTDDENVINTYNQLVGNGEIGFEWVLVDSDSNVIIEHTSNNYFTYLPKKDESVSICLRLVDGCGCKSNVKHVTLDLLTPFEVNYNCIIVDANKTVYFIKNNSYEVGIPSEDFALYFRGVLLNENDNPMGHLMLNKYVKGNNCYLKVTTNDVEDSDYWLGEKVFLQYKWLFDEFFDSSLILDPLENIINDSEELLENERIVTTLPFVICNTQKEEMQYLPFNIIYKNTFPETSTN